MIDRDGLVRAITLPGDPAPECQFFDDLKVIAQYADGTMAILVADFPEFYVVKLDTGRSDPAGYVTHYAHRVGQWLEQEGFTRAYAHPEHPGARTAFERSAATLVERGAGAEEVEWRMGSPRMRQFAAWREGRGPEPEWRRGLP